MVIIPIAVLQTVTVLMLDVRELRELMNPTLIHSVKVLMNTLKE